MVTAITDIADFELGILKQLALDCQVPLIASLAVTVNVRGRTRSSQRTTRGRSRDGVQRPAGAPVDPRYERRIPQHTLNRVTQIRSPKEHAAACSNCPLAR